VAWEQFQLNQVEELLRHLPGRHGRGHVVALLAAVGLVDAAIARLLDIPLGKLQVKFASALELGRLNACLQLLTTLKQRSVAGSTAATIYLIDRFEELEQWERRSDT
jgi:hypothetical protein